MLSSETFACPDFHGQWKSSKKDTLEFIKLWVKMEPKSLDFTKQIIGTMHISYDEKSLKISDISRQIKVNGKLSIWGGTEEIVAYELLGCTDNQVVLKYELFDQEVIYILNFENEDTYWIYVGTPSFSGNAHYREFFVRQ